MEDASGDTGAITGLRCLAAKVGRCLADFVTLQMFSEMSGTVSRIGSGLMGGGGPIFQIVMVPVMNGGFLSLCWRNLLRISGGISIIAIGAVCRCSS